MTRAFYFIVYDIVFHIERKINYFIFILKSRIRDKHPGSATLDKQTCRHVTFERESATGVRQVCNMHVPVYFPPPPIYCTAAVQNSMTTFPFLLLSFCFPHEKERDGDRKKECIGILVIEREGLKFLLKFLIF